MQTEPRVLVTFSNPLATRCALGLLLALPLAFMLLNTFQHPVEFSYDCPLHTECLDSFDTLSSWELHVLPNILSYNSPLYYYVVGKLAAVTGWDSYIVGRLLHLLFIATVAVLVVAVLLPRLFVQGAWCYQLLFVLAAFAVPNFYLAQLMVRTDHLMQFALCLLLILWFRFDWGRTLATSLRAQISWAILLIVLANTRQTAFPVFCVFFLWGIVLLARVPWQGGPHSRWRTVFAAALVLVVVALSGFHYAHRLFTTGRIGLEPSDRYQRRMQHRGFSRLNMLTNMQFNVMWQCPNRGAQYAGGKLDVALWPRLYNDMWGDYWLYFSGDRQQDEKVRWKQVMLIAAIPYTLLLIGSVLYCSALAAWRLIHLQPLTWYETAGLVCFLGTAIFLLSIFIYPRPGKVTLAKFTYMSAFFWAGILSMVYVASRSRALLTSSLIIAAGTFLLAIPLSIFRFDINL